MAVQIHLPIHGVDIIGMDRINKVIQLCQELNIVVRSINTAFDGGYPTVDLELILDAPPQPAKSKPMNFPDEGKLKNDNMWDRIAKRELEKIDDNI